MYIRVVLKSIGPIAFKWAPRLWGTMLELSTHCCLSTHNNTLQALQGTALGPAPPKAGPDVHFKWILFILNILWFLLASCINIY